MSDAKALVAIATKLQGQITLQSGNKFAVNAKSLLGVILAKKLNWDDLRIAIPAFLTLSVMPFTYNISYGIAFGLISYIVINVFCGDAKKIKGSSWVIGSLFIAMLLLTH